MILHLYPQSGVAAGGAARVGTNRSDGRTQPQVSAEAHRTATALSRVPWPINGPIWPRGSGAGDLVSYVSSNGHFEKNFRIRRINILPRLCADNPVLYVSSKVSFGKTFKTRRNTSLLATSSTPFASFVSLLLSLLAYTKYQLIRCLRCIRKGCFSSCLPLSRIAQIFDRLEKFFVKAPLTRQTRQGEAKAASFEALVSSSTVSPREILLPSRQKSFQNALLLRQTRQTSFSSNPRLGSRAVCNVRAATIPWPSIDAAGSQSLLYTVYGGISNGY